MKITINNTKYDDSYTFECETIEEGRKIVAEQNKLRGWNDEDCYSEVEE